ncbi:MAG: STAS domain-containing protein [Leptospiraceae bacterium]|nr:STAS domain-containing protein [Leptospiraceae bacterium]MCB1320507.1 STAS domain-containing protein [Leptospiraceae bacterium]
MKIDRREENGILILKLTGRFTLEQVPIMTEIVDSAIEAGDRFIILNMLNITDISSSGLGKIMGISRSLELRNGRLALAEPSPVVEYVLDLARMLDVFPVYRSEEEAIKSFPPVRRH